MGVHDPPAPAPAEEPLDSRDRIDYHHDGSKPHRPLDCLNFTQPRPSHFAAVAVILICAVLAATPLVTMTVILTHPDKQHVVLMGPLEQRLVTIPTGDLVSVFKVFANSSSSATISVEKFPFPISGDFGSEPLVSTVVDEPWRVEPSSAAQSSPFYLFEGSTISVNYSFASPVFAFILKSGGDIASALFTFGPGSARSFQHTFSKRGDYVLAFSDADSATSSNMGTVNTTLSRIRLSNYLPSQTCFASPQCLFPLAMSRQTSFIISSNASFVSTHSLPIRVTYHSAPRLKFILPLFLSLSCFLCAFLMILVLVSNDLCARVFQQCFGTPSMGYSVLR